MTKPVAGQEMTRFASLDGSRIAYALRPAAIEEAASARAPLVLVHGAGADRRSWHRQLAGLRTERALVALDLPGHGDSDWRQTDDAFGLYARSIETVLDDLGAAQAVLVGHSNGVPTVREASRRIPDRVEALVLVDGALRQVIPEAVRAWMLSALDRPDFETFYAGMVAQMPVAGLSELDAALLREAAQATPRDVFAAELAAMIDEATWRADPIVVPVLAIYTSQPQWSGDYEAFVRRIAPDVEYFVWDDASHFLMLEQADRFNRLLEAFLARLDP